MNKRKIELTAETLKKIEDHALHGLNKTQIAAALGISLSTLERRENETPDVVQDAIDRGRARGVYDVAESLYTMATQDKIVSAAIKYLEFVGGWTDRKQIDITEKKLEPLIIEVTPSSEPEPKEILLNGNGNGRKKRF